MKIRMVTSGVTLIALIVCTSYASAAQQTKERVIERVPVEKNEPLAITAINVNDRSVELGRPFAAPDDWMRSLVISVKNISNKPVLFASIRLVFPRPADSTALASIYDVAYGNNPLMTRQPTPNERLVGIMPGSTAEMSLSAQNFVEIQKFLVGTGYPSDVEKVNVRIGHVIFEDDTMWYAGTVLRRDPNDSGKWVVAVLRVAYAGPIGIVSPARSA